MKVTIPGKFLAILPGIFLSGCAIPVAVSMGVGAASLAVNETTGKSITDHTVSAVNGGKDCRVSRALADQEVCKEKTPEFKITVTTTGVKPSTIEEIQAKYK
jgi:hypothetical protein